MSAGGREPAGGRSTVSSADKRSHRRLVDVDVGLREQRGHDVLVALAHGLEERRRAVERALVAPLHDGLHVAARVQVRAGRAQALHDGEVIVAHGRDELGHRHVWRGAW